MAKRNAHSAEKGAQAANFDRAAPIVGRVAMAVEDAARAAGVGRTTIFMEIRDGRLKGRKVGRRTIILIEDLNDWLSSLPRSRPSESE